MKTKIKQIQTWQLFLLGSTVLSLYGLLLEWIHFIKAVDDPMSRSTIAALDIQLHDTYFIVALLHLILVVSLLLVFIAGAYYLYPKIFKRRMTIILSKIHFWTTLTGAIVLYPFMYFFKQSEPSRYYRFDSFDSYSNHNLFSLYFILVVLGLILLAQIFFIFNFFYSFWKGQKV